MTGLLEEVNRGVGAAAVAKPNIESQFILKLTRQRFSCEPLEGIARRDTPDPVIGFRKGLSVRKPPWRVPPRLEPARAPVGPPPHA